MCEICMWNTGWNDTDGYKPNTMRKNCTPPPGHPPTLYTKNPTLYALIYVTMLRLHSIKL